EPALPNWLRRATPELGLAGGIPPISSLVSGRLRWNRLAAIHPVLSRQDLRRPGGRDDARLRIPNFPSTGSPIRADRLPQRRVEHPDGHRDALLPHRAPDPRPLRQGPVHDLQPTSGVPLRTLGLESDPNSRDERTAPLGSSHSDHGRPELPLGLDGTLNLGALRT